MRAERRLDERRSADGLNEHGLVAGRSCKVNAGDSDCGRGGSGKLVGTVREGQGLRRAALAVKALTIATAVV